MADLVAPPKGPPALLPNIPPSFAAGPARFATAARTTLRRGSRLRVFSTPRRARVNLPGPVSARTTSVLDQSASARAALSQAETANNIRPEVVVGIAAVVALMLAGA